MERLAQSNLLQRGLFALGALLSAAIAVVSYRYLVPGIPALGGIGGNAFVMPWLPVHAAAAATALLVAPLQFRSQLRARHPGFHRLLGRVYVTGCLIGGATGLALAVGRTAGAVGTAGFGSVELVWLAGRAEDWR